MPSKLETDLERIENRLNELSFYLGGLPDIKGDRKEIARFKKGISLMVRHNYGKAGQLFRKSLSSEIRGSDRSVLLLLIGNCYWVGGRGIGYEWSPEQARNVWEKALDAAQQAGDERAEAAALNNLGLTYSVSTERDKALKYLQKSLKVRQKLGDEPGIAQTYYNLGNHHGSEQSKAIRFYDKALRIFQKIGEETNLARTLHALGYKYEALDEFDKAIEHQERYLRIKEKAGDMLGVAKAKGAIAYVYNRQGRKDEANRLLCEVVEIYSRNRPTADMIMKHMEDL